MKMGKKILIIVTLFFLCSLFLIPITNLERPSIFNNLNLKNNSKIKDFSLITKSNNTIAQQGTGSILKGEEYPYNESIKQGLINNDFIEWNIVNTYSGKRFWVKIENLTANRSKNSYETADNDNINEGSLTSGNLSDTYASGGGYYQVNDPNGGNTIDVDFEFNINGIAKQEVVAIYWQVVGQRQWDLLGGNDSQINIWNDTSSSFANIGIVSSIGDFAVYSGNITGNDCFTSSNPRVILNFASSDSDGNYLRLDYVYIRIYYVQTFSSVNPETIGFQVEHNAINYPIYSINGNATTIEGTWAGLSIQNFTFLSNVSSNFDVEYTCFLNKSRNAYTYYYLADNENFDNSWKINYTVGALPSGYNKLNFSIWLPKDWTFINTTAPDGSDHTSFTSTLYILKNLLISVNGSAIDPFISQLPRNWSIWANSSNYITNIQFFKYPDYITPLLNPIIYNITDNMTIKCPLNSPTNSLASANLTIFNSTDDVMHQELFVDVIGSTITFNDWNVSKYNLNGQYKAQVTWFNGTQIGMRNSSFYCVYPTTVQMVDPPRNPFPWGYNRTLEVKIRFLNKFTSTGISSATTAEYIWADNPTKTLNDNLDGTYNLTDPDIDKPLGNYYLYINFSKVGYSNLTNFQIIVNLVNDTELTLTVENFSKNLTNPTIIDSYYPENITITANYTQLWVTQKNPLDNAIVNVSFNGIYYADMIPKPGEPGIYYLIVNSSELIYSFSEVGQNNVTVYAWKNGYFPNSNTFKWNFFETPTSLTANISTHSGYGGIPFNVKLHFNNTYHNYRYNITDSNFTIRYGVTQTLYDLHNDNITNYFNGTYVIVINIDIYNINYNFQLNITSWRPGYQNQTIMIDTTLWVYNTSIVYWNYPSVIPLYSNQTIELGINRSDFGGGIPPDIDIKINQSYGVYWYNTTDVGNYTIRLITDHKISNLNASVQKVNITINKTNHEVQYLFSTFQIRENRTLAYITQCYEEFKFIEFDVGNRYQIDLHLNQTLDIFVNYTNNETGSKSILKNKTSDIIDITAKLYNATDKSWIDDLNVTAYLNNQFNITIDSISLNLPIGEYFLNISLKKLNYERAFIFVNLSVVPWNSYLIPTDLVPTNQIQWKDQTISFKANYSKIIFNASSPRTGFVEFITDAAQWNAEINYTIKNLLNQTVKTGTRLIYNNITKLWELNETIYLKDNMNNTIPPGLYKIWLNSSANNIVFRNTIIDLRILEWLPSTIIFLSPPQISEGGSLLLYLKFDINNTKDPTSEKRQNLILSLTLIMEGGLPIPLEIPITTGQDGTYYLQLPLFEGVKSIFCLVKFHGINATYPKWAVNPSQSNPMMIEITSIWPFLIPIFIVATVVFGGVLIIYTVNKKFRVKRQTKVMEEAEKTFDYFSDLISLRKIYIIHKKLEKPLFQQNYNMEDFNDFTNKALINMIKGFGKGKSGYKASLDLVRFQDMIIIIDDGDLTRSAFILSKPPSNKFLKGMVRFLQFFEINNYNILKKDGGMVDISKIGDLLDYIFEISVILPYRVTMKGMSMKLNAFRSKLVMTAYDNSPEGYFFIADLFNKILAESMMPEMMVFKEISYLIDKRAFILYSLNELKEKGRKLKYISDKKVELPKTGEELKAPKIEKAAIEEEYITPVTARKVEEYELPKPTLPSKLPPSEPEMFEEEEMEGEEKTPYELIKEKEFREPEIEKREELVKSLPKEIGKDDKKETALLKELLEKPTVKKTKEKERKIGKKPKPIKPVSIKPIPIKHVAKPKILKPITSKPIPSVKKPTAVPEKKIPKPSKFIQISDKEKNKINKSVLEIVTNTNKLINSIDEIEKYIGNAVQEIVINKKIVDDITLGVLKLFEKPSKIVEKELGTAKSQLKRAEKLVEKLFFYLIDIEKDLEISDKEFSVISKDIKMIRKKFDKQPRSKIELELQKLDQVKEKLGELDEKIVKSLEIREKFEARLNESAKIVEKLDDKVIETEKKIKSRKTSKIDFEDEKNTTYKLRFHCPTCNKIIAEREINLLKKGFTPECPACGNVLKSTDFDL